MWWRAGLSIVVAFAGVLGACSTFPEEKPSCFLTGCGVHGKCEPTTARCVCDRGHDGPTCTQCATGFQDANGDGSCLEVCGGQVCSLHSRCGTETGRAMCSCTAGYASEGRGSCKFVGGPRDPDFLGTPAESWTVEGAVALTTGTTPYVEDFVDRRGWARFYGDGEISQTIEMPAYADAEPLALVINTACGTAKGCANIGGFGSATLFFDDRPLDWNITPASAGIPVDRRRFCLGERAFGRTLKLGVRTYAPPGEVKDKAESAFIDSIAMGPAPDCAPPGSIINGSFELGGWPEMQPGAQVIDGEASLFAGCQQPVAAMSTSISVPEVLSQPAIRFTMRGEPAGTLSLALDNVRIGTLTPTAGTERPVVCLPRWARGLAFTLDVTWQARCSPGIDANVTLDDFVLGSDAACGPDVIDGSFEQGQLTSWISTGASIARTPGEAHSGSAYAQLLTWCTGTASSDSAQLFTLGLTAPDRSAEVSGGPALKLWYRLPSGSASVSAFADQLLPLAITPAWTEKVVCLPRHAWGRRTSLGITLQGFSDTGLCSSSVLQVDDVSVGVDRSCSAD